MYYHGLPVFVNGRWRTPFEGDKGFPDTVIARRGRIIVAELKANDGRPEPEQLRWLEELGPIGRLWRPRDRPKIIRELTSREIPPG